MTPKVHAKHIDFSAIDERGVIEEHSRRKHLKLIRPASSDPVLRETTLKVFRERHCNGNLEE